MPLSIKSKAELEEADLIGFLGVNKSRYVAGKEPTGTLYLSIAESQPRDTPADKRTSPLFFAYINVAELQDVLIGRKATIVVRKYKRKEQEPAE